MWVKGLSCHVMAVFVWCTDDHGDDDGGNHGNHGNKHQQTTNNIKKLQSQLHLQFDFNYDFTTTAATTTTTTTILYYSYI